MLNPPSKKYINITMVRHAQSLANIYKDTYGANPTDLSFTNSKLSDLGKYQIEKTRDEIIKNIGSYDLILTSPLKRAIQTCQLVLQNDKINNRYPSAIMAELGDHIENYFHSRKDTSIDSDITTLPNYDKIIWNDNKKYDLMWKTNYYKNDARTDKRFYNDPVLRILLLKDFLANLNNGNNINNVLIFTHWVIIKELTGIDSDNLSTVKFRFNCTDQTIDNIEYIPIQISQNINITFIANADSNELDINPLKLTDLGKSQIEQSRNEILKNIGDISKYVILSSPLKNAIQTSQLVLKDKNVIIYPCAIVSDFTNTMNIGNKQIISRTTLKRDIDLMKVHTPVIDWTNHKLYDYGWKDQYKNSDPKTDNNFYTYIAMRLHFFFEYLCINFKNKDKDVLIFGHPSFISHITNNIFRSDNLDIFKFNYLCDKNKIENFIKVNILTQIQQPLLQQKLEEINILSYNICYQCMLKKKEGTVKYLCDNSCKQNITSFINSELQNKDFDFIGLQEASGYDYIIKNSPKLQTMNFEHYKPGFEDMILFYNKTKYILDKNYMVKSWMHDTGRPFMILFFNDNICVINIHAGHRDDITRFDDHLQNTCKGLKHNSVVIGKEAEILAKIKTYNIICMGDFNKSITPGFRILNRPLYGPTATTTCCDSVNLFIKNYNINSGEYIGSYDQILTSWNDANSTIVHNPPPPASDHLPVSRTVNIPILGGKNNMYDKYMKYKYKYKYMQLK